MKDDPCAPPPLEATCESDRVLPGGDANDGRNAPDGEDSAVRQWEEASRNRTAPFSGRFLRRSIRRQSTVFRSRCAGGLWHNTCTFSLGSDT